VRRSFIPARGSRGAEGLSLEADRRSVAAMRRSFEEERRSVMPPPVHMHLAAFIEGSDSDLDTL
jgi:hypothetical protein